MREIWRRWLLEGAEVALLIPAFALIVPPVPSIEGQEYRLLPAVLWGGSLFAASMALQWKRGAHHWLVGATKLVLFIAFAWGLHERARIH